MPEPDPNYPLEYRDAAAERKPLSNYVLAALGGVAVSAGVVTFLVAIWVLANLHLGPEPPPPPAPQPPPPPLVWKGPAVFSALVLGCLIGVAVFAYRRPRFRWFAAGLLIGFGVTALAEGICFRVNG